jgi:hypothetical protein
MKADNSKKRAALAPVESGLAGRRKSHGPFQMLDFEFPSLSRGIRCGRAT